MQGSKFAKGRGRASGCVLLAGLLAGFLAGLAFNPGQARAMAEHGAAPAGTGSAAG